MIDQWFKKDLQRVFDRHSVAVFIDESGGAEFLLRTVDGQYTVYEAHSEIEELHVKYLIESSRSGQEKFLIHTRTRKENLKFVREYCETCGCLEIRSLRNYIKRKVYDTLNLNINLPEEELAAAAKVSIGKDKTYWMDIIHKGPSEIFDLKTELLPFLHDPLGFSMEKYDDQIRDIFYRKVNALLDQEYISKPSATLAEEVVNAMLDGLARDSCDPVLEAVYRNWLDSKRFGFSLDGYVKNYQPPSNIDIWAVNINHPFKTLDERWLEEIGGRIDDKDALKGYLEKIGRRSRSKQAQAVGIVFWKDVITLLEFDPGKIAYLNSFAECVEFYTNRFYMLDTAIRRLYAAFLNQKHLLEPFQELYKQTTAVFLDKWFSYFHEYEENQTGTLQRIIDSCSGKTAVIVGDGVAYEIAVLIAEKVDSRFKHAPDSVLADIPSDTANNMSRIYMDDGAVETVHSNREKYLVARNPDRTIDFTRLDDVSGDARPGQFLICTYKDIDDMGEKLQQQALKYFPETIDFFADKINTLLESGYERVYLIADHGFVLTGLLRESDKISVSIDGSVKTAERYVRSKKKAPVDSSFVVKESAGEYFYFSKSMSPFKSVGVYGYSHGGVTPQEIVTPFFCWKTPDEAIPALPVKIGNKDDLTGFAGDSFVLKIQSGKAAGDLFALERKVLLVFFAGGKQVNKSDVITIGPDETITKEYDFDGHEEIEVQLLDALSKQQLDRAMIKQDKARDLGGLM